jgi:hypothetical protein
MGWRLGSSTGRKVYPFVLSRQNVLVRQVRIESQRDMESFEVKVQTVEKEVGSCGSFGRTDQQ